MAQPCLNILKVQFLGKLQELCLGVNQGARSYVGGCSGLYLHDMLTLKGLNAGGYIDCVIDAQPCLAHMATAPGKHSSFLADHHSMLTPTRHLMYQDIVYTCPQE